MVSTLGWCADVGLVVVERCHDSLVLGFGLGFVDLVGLKNLAARGRWVAMVWCKYLLHSWGAHKGCGRVTMRQRAHDKGGGRRHCAGAPGTMDGFVDTKEAVSTCSARFSRTMRPCGVLSACNTRRAPVSQRHSYPGKNAGVWADRIRSHTIDLYLLPCSVCPGLITIVGRSSHKLPCLMNHSSIQSLSHQGSQCASCFLSCFLGSMLHSAPSPPTLQV